MTFPNAFASHRPARSRAHTPARVCVAMAGLIVACQASAAVEAADGSGAASRSRIVDPAFQPAGGVGCTSCGPAGCRQVHGGHHGHHSGCRDGVCVPYCPVRPQQFGFYGTQWRRWPGQAIMPVSAESDAAPIAPPKSAVPGPAEESLNPQGDGEGEADASESASPLAPPSQPLPEPAVRPQPTPGPGLLEPAPESRPQPKAGVETESQPEPTREPAKESPRQATPPARPAEETKPGAAEPARQAPETKPRPEDENLFEVLSGWRARRTFPVGPAGGSDDATREGLRRAGHAEESAARQVPRVPFDPAAETRRLRSAR